jgi:hypothetical protein
MQGWVLNKGAQSNIVVTLTCLLSYQTSNILLRAGRVSLALLDFPGQFVGVPLRGTCQNIERLRTLVACATTELRANASQDEIFWMKRANKN